MRTLGETREANQLKNVGEVLKRAASTLKCSRQGGRRPLVASYAVVFYLEQVIISTDWKPGVLVPI